MKGGESRDVVAGVDINSFAVGLSQATDEEQAQFFNTFGSALYRECRGEYRFDMQLHGVRDHLDERGKAVAALLNYKVSE